MSEALIRTFATPAWINAALMLNFAATWYMVGVIVFVQIVHYPLFKKVGRDGFAVYADRHQWLTSWVVGGPMITEALLAAVFMIWLATPEGLARLDGQTVFVNIGLALFILGVTAVFSIPCHAALAVGYDDRVVSRLVWTNWLRTAAWTAKGLVAAQMLAGAMSWATVAEGYQ